MDFCFREGGHVKKSAFVVQITLNNAVVKEITAYWWKNE